MPKDLLGYITNGWQRGSLAWRMRRARMKILLDLITDLPRPVRILDVGGAEPYWASLLPDAAGTSDTAGSPSEGAEPMNDLSAGELQVTMVNLHPQETTLPNVRAVTGSALDLSGFDRSDYDVIFSNSVIEHLGSLDKQRRMASEVLRMDLRYFVQTPNCYFPVEPHFLLPLFQFLPRAGRIWLASHWRYGSYCRPGNVAAATEVVDEIRLLSAAEMGALFPGARLHLERFGPLVKSVTAVGRVA
jgi:hypothetical protein